MMPRVKKPGYKEKKKDTDLVRQFSRWINEGADNCSDIHARVEENWNYVSGDQWAKGDLERQKQRERPAMPLNKIMPVLNAIANREIMNRYVPRAYGRAGQDEQWAEVANMFIDWQRENAESEHEESMAFRAAVASGYGCMHFFWDPLANEGDGALMQEEVPIWMMLWDSRARKQNLVDRRWHVCGKWVPLDEAEQRWGLTKEGQDLFKKARNDDQTMLSAGTDLVMHNHQGRWAWDGVASGRWTNSAEKEIFITEVEWKDTKSFYRAAVPTRMAEWAAFLVDPNGQFQYGEDEQGNPQVLTYQQYLQMEPEMQQEWTNSIMMDTTLVDYETREELLAIGDQYEDLFGVEFTLYTVQDRYEYKYAIMIQDVLVEQGIRPMGFTYEFITGFPWDTKERTKFTGFVDLAKGLQDWRNAFMSLALTRLATSPKSQLLIEEGVIDDQDEFLDQIANPRGVQFVPDGFVSSGRWIKLDPPTFAPVDRELIALADQGINELVGISGIELGQQGDLRRISGNVVQSVKEASNTILALLFDGLRRYRKRAGKLILGFMHEMYTPEEIARIVGEEKSQFILPYEEWPDASLFDIKFDEGRASISEKMETFDFLTRTGTFQDWVNRGWLPMEVALEMIPSLTESDKMKIRQHMQRVQQQNDRFNQLWEFLQQDQSGAGQQLAQQFQQQAQQQGQ